MTITAMLTRFRTDDGPTACGNGCGIVVAPDRGVRDRRGVFCSAACLDDWIDAGVM